MVARESSTVLTTLVEVKILTEGGIVRVGVDILTPTVEELVQASRHVNNCERKQNKAIRTNPGCSGTCNRMYAQQQWLDPV